MKKTIFKFELFLLAEGFPSVVFGETNLTESSHVLMVTKNYRIYHNNS